MGLIGAAEQNLLKLFEYLILEPTHALPQIPKANEQAEKIIY